MIGHNAVSVTFIVTESDCSLLPSELVSMLIVLFVWGGNMTTWPRDHLLLSHNMFQCLTKLLPVRSKEKPLESFLVRLIIRKSCVALIKVPHLQHPCCSCRICPALLLSQLTPGYSSHPYFLKEIQCLTLIGWKQFQILAFQDWFCKNSDFKSPSHPAVKEKGAKHGELLHSLLTTSCLPPNTFAMGIQAN